MAKGARPELFHGKRSQKGKSVFPITKNTIDMLKVLVPRDGKHTA